jgi:two-component system C4-dicarboxylate transport sensor histidine kinase DctB
MPLADSVHPSAGLPRPGAHRAAPPRAAAWWRWGLAAALCVALGVFVHHSTYASHLAADKRAAARRVEFFALSLEALLARNEALPGLMALEGRLAALLDAATPATRDAANRHLEAAVRIADVSAAYVMDGEGLTLAASNWNRPFSFVGQRYDFRPYFQDAIAGRTGRFYGIGATTGEAGYFLASRVRTARGAQGVIAVKVALEPFEQAMRQSGEVVFVADREGVILLSAEADWKYRVLEPMSARTLERLKPTRQYGSQALQPLVPGVAIGAQRESLRLVRDGAEAEFSLTAKPVGQLGWRMVMLTDRSAAKTAAAVAGSAASLGAALLIGLFMYWRLSRRRREERLAAQQALEAVHDSLEARIARRTAEVTAANRALEERVATLKQTEEILRQTRDGAVQAGKLAVLGQMSVGMSHELNQPLAALHTLSDNAILLLDKNRTEETKENLALISQLAARMGRIVRQLKAFARKEPAPLGPVDVAEALEHALMLVDSMRQALHADIVVEPLAAGLRVKADAVRLEQVLVNLVRNGLEAMAGGDPPLLRIRAERLGKRVAIVIRDAGPGIPPAALSRLFEPFFTTKPVGQGLGLGLALSLVIVEGFGGRLEGCNAEGGGAEFRVVLEAA